MRPLPLPTGLSICAACGAVRGKTPTGRLSVCFCQGVICNWCDGRMRRPITDYYNPRGPGRWVHVPYFALGAHGCSAPPGRRVGPHYTILPIDSDVKAYRERVTQVTRAEMSARARLSKPSRKVH